MKVGEPRPADARTPRPPRQRLLQESRRRTDFSAAYKDSCRPDHSARPQHDERERCTSPTRVGLTRSSDLGGRLTVLFPEFTGNVETYYGRRTQVITQPAVPCLNAEPPVGSGRHSEPLRSNFFSFIFYAIFGPSVVPCVAKRTHAPDSSWALSGFPGVMTIRSFIKHPLTEGGVIRK